MENALKGNERVGKWEGGEGKPVGTWEWASILKEGRFSKVQVSGST